MERRKLVIEKVYDREAVLVMRGAQNHADVCEQFIEDAQGCMRFVAQLADVNACRAVAAGCAPRPSAPFDDVWLELLGLDGEAVACVAYHKRTGEVSVYEYYGYTVGNPALLKHGTSRAISLGDDGWYDTTNIPEDARSEVLSLEADLAGTKWPTPRERTVSFVRTMGAMFWFFCELLNVQGDVVRERLEAPAEVNAKRAKRGKPQLQPYTYVYLNRETDHSNSVESTGRVVSQHIRRGHFKRTRHGTFWWRPCVVGSGPAKERRAYIVKS